MTRKAARKTKFRVYYNGTEASTSTYFYTDTHPKPWTVVVRATSRAEAKRLTLHGQVADDKGLGIVYVDHSDGPMMLENSWPFPFDISEVGNGWGY